MISPALKPVHASGAWTQLYGVFGGSLCTRSGHTSINSRISSEIVLGLNVSSSLRSSLSPAGGTKRPRKVHGLTKLDRQREEDLLAVAHGVSRAHSEAEHHALRTNDPRGTPVPIGLNQVIRINSHRVHNEALVDLVYCVTASLGGVIRRYAPSAIP